MPRRAREPIPVYVGVGSHVVAIDSETGEEIWRTKLKSASFVTVCVQDRHIYAGASGELWCLNPSGEIVWHNKLKGLGMGIVGFAGTDVASMQAMLAAQEAAAAATIAATS